MGPACSGPAGLFAALELAQAGLAVVIVERGQPVESRGRDIGALIVRRMLNPESNLCYGQLLHPVVSTKTTAWITLVCGFSCPRHNSDFDHVGFPNKNVGLAYHFWLEAVTMRSVVAQPDTIRELSAMY